MMKRGIILIIASLLLLQLATAEIMLSQPKSLYNLGDELKISTTVKVNENSDGFLNLELNCENQSNDFYLSPLTLSAGQEKTIDNTLSLTPSFLKGMKGDCSIKASYLSDFYSTSTFEITGRIDVSLDIDRASFNGGEKAIIKGTAIKANSQAVNGFVEIEIENTDIKIIRNVQNGKFESNFTMPENAKSGNYVLKANVYEKIANEISNQGISTLLLTVKQTPKKIDIAITSQSVKPGESIKFKAILYDQSNTEITGDVSIEIRDSLDDLILKKLVKAGEESELKTEKNYSAGYWRIEAKSSELESKRLFYIEELEEASFKIINDTLIITNTGNVPYRKAVQIAIGNEVEIKQLDLDIDESTKFRLLAPDGKYKVGVTDGSNILNLDEVSLTGNAVGVIDIRSQAGMLNRYPIVWLFLIVVLGLFILMMVQRVMKKNFFAYKPEEKHEKKGIFKEEIFKADKNFKEIGKNEIGDAEHSLVLKGNKENAGIISIKIKGNANQETINRINEEIKEKKGTLYKSGEDIIAILTPSLTKTFKNEIIAVKVASTIASTLQEHNRKFKDKIDFGIGVNSGDIIAKIEQGKLKFTSLGNTINLAKKVSSLANGDVLLSENVHNKLLSEVKAEKQVKEGLNVYSIKDIVDREQHKKFIDGFLKRV